MLSAVSNIPAVVKSKGVIYDAPDEEARSCPFDEKLEEKSNAPADLVEASSSPREASRLQSDTVQPFHCIRSAESSFGFPETTEFLVSGGFQQYLIKCQLQREMNAPRKTVNDEFYTFGILDLPDMIQLYVFSFLDAKTLCAVCNVCCRWSWLSCDELLWQRKLQQDADKWRYIGDSTNPNFYQNHSSNLSQKEIYMRCSPVVVEWSRQNHFILHRLSSIIRSLWPKKVPRVAMFGPGLESHTSFIVRKILEDKSGMFQTLGMFPGKFEGIGSGFTVKVKNCVTIDLITIYNETKDVRENWSSAERLRLSRTGNKAERRPELGKTFELQHAMKEFCRTLDAFIFVVDATLPPEELELAQPELFAMTEDEWTQSLAPVLVLSCIPDSRTGHPISCRTILQHLDLQKLNRPWQVHKCCVDTMNGVESGLQWMVETCHRR